MILEVVVQSADDALAAEAAGADRLELVSALSLGGLTPSIGTLEETLSRCKLPVMAMLRPRSGGFAYSADDIAAMVRDGERLLATGARGLVFGVLERGAINVIANAKLVGLGGAATFHRAFDTLADPYEALERLIDLGFWRILTSGGPGTALEGADAIRRLVERADERIEIVAGGGVRATNVNEIVARTGVSQVHLGAVEWVADGSQGGIAFNSPHPEDRYARVNGQVVSEVRRESGNASL